jgi:hypothetical protein
MKLRTKPTGRTASSNGEPAVQDQPKPAVKKGGVRPGAGRPPFAAGKRKERPTYVALTAAEFDKLERAAQKRRLSVSFYIRERLGLPVD